MSDGKFNQTQMSAACAVMHQYGVQHGGTGTDIHQRTAVLAIFAIMLGRLNSVPEVYRGLIGDVDVSALSADEARLAAAVAELDAGGGVETVMVTVADKERWETILTGLLIDTTERNLTLTPEAAALLREPDGEFPTEGIYVPFTTMVAGVEAAVTAATEGMVKASDLPQAAEPNGDGNGETNLEGMTVDALRDFATENSVDLEGATKKGDIIARLREFGF